jgi:hypothetical protein
MVCLVPGDPTQGCGCNYTDANGDDTPYVGACSAEIVANGCPNGSGNTRPSPNPTLTP